MQGFPNTESEPVQGGSKSQRLGEVAGYFLRLGITAFGGPAAHVSLMHAELVQKRRWVSEQHFLDLLGATNLIPGPNSTEMAIHLGFIRAGWPGLIAGGVCFILPAMLIVLGLGWVYVNYGSTPQAGWLMYGIQPVVIGIILDALLSLGKRAVRGWLMAAVGVAVMTGYFLGVNEIGLLFAGGLLVSISRMVGRKGLKGNAAGLPLFGLPLLAAVTQSFNLSTLFFIFLKIGSLLYGSGYVLLAFLRADLVQRLGWLTDTQLIEAISIGQITPGPVFTTATFIGYILGGLPGGILATVGIFLPGFIFVALSNPLIPKIRASAWASSLLDGINVASLGLMAAVTLRLGAVAVVDLLTGSLAVASFVCIKVFKVNPTWLILTGFLIGVGKGWLTG